MSIRRGLVVGIIGAVVSALGWAQDSSPENDLVVHEWGTFTSMQGSDGVTLEGLHHEEQALPAFVHNYGRYYGDLRRDLEMTKGVPGVLAKVTEKMETPVTYFYTKRARTVRARVTFNHGLLTQWYPYAALQGLPGRKVPPVIDVSRIDKSALEWDVDVLAPGKGAEQLVQVGAGDPWGFARIPDSNVVRPVKAPVLKSGSNETEKFLFYRGLGEFTLPIKATTAPGAKVTIANDGEDPIRHLFVLHVRNGRGEYAYVPELAARESTTVLRPLAPDAPEIKDMVGRLKAELERCLVSEGLYQKEAVAMASTWEKSYFYTEGLRVLYVVPDRVTEQLLPLQIQPAPKEMKRVLVGRLECLAPEVEAEVAAALRDRASENAATRDSAGERLSKLGRFLEPQVRRALASSTDPLVRKSAREVLKPYEVRVAAR